MASASPTTAQRSGRAQLAVSILLGFITSILLDLCFPVAGPLRAWQPMLAWIALVPLFYALLNERAAAHPGYLRRAALVGYLSGLLWYILNCYWIYQTMLLYGNMPALGAAGMLFLFSAVLGLYFGLFGLLTAFFRRHLGLTATLILAPFLWTALELAAARITSVPWDQLGYSQIDNFLLTSFAPWTGVYGITFVLVFVNAVVVASLISSHRMSAAILTASWAAVVVGVGVIGMRSAPPPAPTSATAVLLQDNLSVDRDNSWVGQVYDRRTHSWVSIWNRNIDRFLTASDQPCTPYYAGLPQTGLELRPPLGCSPKTPISLIAWPEAPSPFRGWDPRFTSAMAALTQLTGATAVAGNIASGVVTGPAGVPAYTEYNSATVFAPNGRQIGRYDKIHLVPFGEFVPYRKFFFFAHHLTQQLGDFGRGARRFVFPIGSDKPGPATHSFGVFICYESVFADEVRQFALNGAQVLVNISDDGWYGDTSAPWQHLNMSRMRAVENRRWLLLDTNSGVTAAIDPYGRVTQSAPRHIFTSLAVQYGYRSDLTFYTRYGDLFGYLCCIVVVAAFALGLWRAGSR
ncbi:MAG: apolipoprotein N-acyltransferase [Acidobacteriaceae bacterium]